MVGRWLWQGLAWGGTGEPEARVADRELVVHTAPDSAAPERGRIDAGSAFWTLGPAPPARDGRCAAGWARVEAQGFVCLDGTAPTGLSPSPQPPLLPFSPPLPSQYDVYLQSGGYEPQEGELLLPAVWGRRWRRFRGALYASPEALDAGEAPVGRLPSRPVPFVEAGPGWLALQDGRAAKISEVYVSPASRLQGRPLREQPPGTWPALAVAYGGLAVRRAPDPEGAVAGWLPYHSWVQIEQAPASPDGRWWRVPGAGGGGAPGYVLEQDGLRHPLPAGPAPEGLGESEPWVALWPEQQALGVFEGDALVYFAAVSVGGRGLRPGERRIRGKQARAELGRGPALRDVPWAMSLGRDCAMHGAWWHWGFGWPAREGCLQLAPRDAALLFSWLSPRLPDGWSEVVALPGEGTVVRVSP